jgi:hypothetical protein
MHRPALVLVGALALAAVGCGGDDRDAFRGRLSAALGS